MNPWLEQPDAWHDFHQALIGTIRVALTEQIRPNYIAKVDENVYIHELSADQRMLLGRPDVGVFDGPGSRTATHQGATTTPIAFGSLLPHTDRIREPFIEIRDTAYRDLITVIELLSPTNKQSGPDREQYLAKRKLLLSGNVHLIEIDLLRGGTRMPVDGLAQCDYSIMVSRSHERPRVGLWPIKLRQPLPRIPVPLKPDDRDAVLDLQQLLQKTFDEAGYADYIYQGTPRPSLHPEDEAWAEEFLR